MEFGGIASQLTHGDFDPRRPEISRTLPPPLHFSRRSRREKSNPFYYFVYTCINWLIDAQLPVAVPRMQAILDANSSITRDPVAWVRNEAGKLLRRLLNDHSLSRMEFFSVDGITDRSIPLADVFEIGGEFHFASQRENSRSWTIAKTIVVVSTSSSSKKYLLLTFIQYSCQNALYFLIIYLLNFLLAEDKEFFSSNYKIQSHFVTTF